MVIALLCLLIVAESEGAKPACYPHLGCFSMDPPWLTDDRPIPAPDPPYKQQIRAFFYSRPHTERQTIIQTWPSIDLHGAKFDKKKMTFFATHGFENSGNDKWMTELKDALLNKSDANVFIGDWVNGAKGVSYFQAVGNLRMAARQFANLLQFLIDQKGLDVNKLHIMGHSLGSQICAQMAKSIPGIYMLTAMDPSQPGFEGSGPKVRLVKSDAFFVVAVHADARPFVPDLGFGYMNEVADVDFYMNSGHGQPGCSFPKVVNIPKINKLSDFTAVQYEIFVQTLLCPHGLSHVFFTESIASPDCIFWGHNASMADMLRGVANAATQGFFSKYLGNSDKCTYETCSPMGLDTYFWPGRGSFVVTTRGSPPYCIFESSIIKESSQLQFVYNLHKAGIKFLQTNSSYDST